MHNFDMHTWRLLFPWQARETELIHTLVFELLHHFFYNMHDTKVSNSANINIYYLGLVG